MTDNIEVNGISPNISGSFCQAVWRQEYWYKGKLEESPYVTYLKFGNVWHRLYFDWGTIFWRVDITPPEPFDALELDATYPIINWGQELGVVGTQLISYSAESIVGGTRIQFLFANGIKLSIRNISDRTSYEVVRNQPIAD